MMMFTYHVNYLFGFQLITCIILENIKPLYFNDTVYDYVNCDLNIIRSSLDNINCDILFNVLHINYTVNIFYYNVFKIIDYH
jgi:hypothetical protein